MSATNIERVSKLEAAQRQLRVAIRLLFTEGDAVATHTLVGAAAMLLSNLVEHAAPDRSWDRKAQSAIGLSAKEYFGVFRRYQNFLKHAKNDPSEVLELNPEETESLAFWAVLNASELGSLSPEEQVYRLWYLAARAPAMNPKLSPLKEALEVFGDLRPLPASARRAAGLKVLLLQNEA